MGNSKTAKRIIAESKQKKIFDPYLKENHIKINARPTNNNLVGVIKEIKVAANSEGYILIDLPDTLTKTKNVKIRLSAIGPPLKRKADLDKKISSIIEADRLELSQVISEVSVDIVKEVKKLP